ncbi:MAG TPA: hypothetical protein VFA20_28695 [Myxococcaceae bacterium]|nr:hypothetical protein [Myxococcaceae bacterium]
MGASLGLLTLIAAVAMVWLDPFLHLVASHWYYVNFEQTHLRSRKVDPCHFQLLEDPPQGPGHFSVWQLGDSRGLLETGFPRATRYDAGSRVVEVLECTPDAGYPEPPNEVTFDPPLFDPSAGAGCGREPDCVRDGTCKTPFRF